MCDFMSIYAKLTRIALRTDTSAMPPKTFRDFLTYIDRAQRIVRLEAEQAGIEIR